MKILISVGEYTIGLHIFAKDGCEAISLFFLDWNELLNSFDITNNKQKIRIMSHDKWLNDVLER